MAECNVSPTLSSPRSFGSGGSGDAALVCQATGTLQSSGLAFGRSTLLVKAWV